MIEMIERQLQRITLAALLAVGVTLGFISTLAWLTLHDSPTTSHDIVMALTGVLGAQFASVINYHFGSSSGSAKKTEIMANGKKPE